MPRQIKIRTSYQADVTYLSRLSQAIDMDRRFKDPWKKLLKRKVNEVMMLLMEADTRNGK